MLLQLTIDTKNPGDVDALWQLLVTLRPGLAPTLAPPPSPVETASDDALRAAGAAATPPTVSDGGQAPKRKRGRPRTVLPVIVPAPAAGSAALLAPVAVSAPAVESATPAPVVVPTAPVPAVGEEDLSDEALKSRLLKFAESRPEGEGRAAAINLLRAFGEWDEKTGRPKGVKKVTDLPQEQRAEFMAALRKAGG